MTGPELKIVRELLDVTQAKLAQFCGVDQATLSRWESKGVPDGPPQIVVNLLVMRMRAHFRNILSSSRGASSSTRPPREARGGE